MRQDSESGSSSDVDAEAVAKRKNEALLDRPAAKGKAADDTGKSDKRRKSESSESEHVSMLG